MSKRIIPILLLLLLLIPLTAQNTLNISGLNEAKFTYRTSEDSLHAYFADSFAFNLAYRNFSFGMKFIAELPKHPVEQTQIYEELDPASLNMQWKELYAEYSKSDYTFHAGTTEETFGNGLVFRSFKDQEFDLDNRVESFLFKYDNKMKLKAIYGAIESNDYVEKYNLAYGLDAQYPALDWLKFGASAMSFRDLISSTDYSKQDVFGGRMDISLSNLDLQGEYALTKLFHGIDPIKGKAAYVNGSYGLGALTLGAAYMNYENFLYRLHDLPLANHHGETLSDAQATGDDEEGMQGYATYVLSENLSMNLDYAEAWNGDKSLQMNDGYASLDWTKGDTSWGLSYGHIEKLNDNSDQWQQEMIPGASASFNLFKMPVQLQAEYKMIEKQHQNVTLKHAEPRLQADFILWELSLAAGVQSSWDSERGMFKGQYWPYLEAKYLLAGQTDLTVFAGKETGGKVCRNGLCRYVAAFEGLKVELATRF